MMRQLLFLIVLVLTFSVLCYGQEDELSEDPGYTSQNGYWYPRETSSTAARRAGVTQEELRAKGYTLRVVLDSPLPVDRMRYYNKTSRVLGWTRRTASKKPIVIGPGAIVWFNPNDLTKAYAEGCLNEFEISVPFKPSGPVPQPAPVPQSTPLPPPMCKNANITIEEARRIGLTITSEGLCVTPTPQPAPEPEECPQCPRISYKANKEGVWNTTQVLTSAGVGGVGTGILSDGNAWKRFKKGSLGAGVSAGATLISRIPKSNRGDKSFTFTVTFPDKTPDTFTVKRGEDHVAKGFKLNWIEDHWEVDSEYCFGSFAPKTTFVFTPVILQLKKGKKIEVIKEEPIKDHPKTGNPRTGTSGNGRDTIPGGSVPVTGPTTPTIPRRPFSNTLVESSTQPLPSQQQNNNSAQPTNQTPRYEEVIVNGQKKTARVL